MKKTINNVPILGFAAYSGTGKTTLLEALLPLLTESGLRVGVLKHAHHNFDVDKPGKDSYRLRKAGASQMLIASRYRHALMTETPEAEAEFEHLLARFDHQGLDLILVEGCKNIAFPKIELNRQQVGKPWLYVNDNNIIAIACDSQPETSLPTVDINDLSAIKALVINYLDADSKASAANCCDTLSPALLSVTQGQQKILDAIPLLKQSESVELEQALGRVLATDIASPINVPAYTNSAMDGYAIRGDDIGSSDFKVVGSVMAGYGFEGELQAGQAIQIMTGAPMPSGGDTVVMREQAVTSADRVSFGEAVIKQGQNVRQAGEDLAQGKPVFTAGTAIKSAELGMIASLGIDQVSVIKQLKVAVFSTGDEVQAPGSPLKANSIYDSNRYTIKSMLTQLGCNILDLGILADDESEMEQAIVTASEQADMIITSGGVSVGDADFIKNVLEKRGNVDFWRINMRPGRPLAFGHIDQVPFFGLPGNPVAVMVSFINFVEPAIKKMQGVREFTPLKVTAIASESLRSRQGRTEFSRGIYDFDPQSGQLSVKTTGKQGSGILRSMSEANCLIEIAPHVDMVKVGESVTIIPLQGRI
ncbi:bifunctional molybdopterin-guanine dinucleotide biosynthesis adaptor protein MobB/molybdopterin molybdotransferase MoeA [Vibrio hippocampi]|uniref:bifunctional molybdopterin-guanine dinucleotide biosynthesis adaptor protein MobB/molybdopterin molybdotransferase MoeA n=1 Tax=Vibrio hippocampi TaxID=654686 RepID=UPI001F00799C|nr:bifunctional molybdopterin-guanine dinucleotide biosynthesis adaptor protein MobB/molybdopterin molybdotransferase MoeA [Vibrio hippocampi]